MNEEHGTPETPEHQPEGGTSPAPNGSSTGLDANVAGALSYLVGPVTGVLFLVLEKKSAFVRFHAAQSVGISLVFIALWVLLGLLSTVFAVIPVVGWIVGLLALLLSFVVGLGGFILWIFLMVQAWSGREWEIPWVGDQSRKVLLKGGEAASP